MATPSSSATISSNSSASTSRTTFPPTKKKIPTWTTLSSGAVSGLASCLLLQPIDLLKTRMQQQHSISDLPSNAKGKAKETRTARLVYTFQKVLKDDGVKGFWRGTVPTVVRNVPGVAIYFYSVSELRSIVSTSQVPILSIPISTNETSLRNNNSSSGSTLSKLSTAGNLLTGAVARTAVGFVLSPITIVKTRFESSHFPHHLYPTLLSSLTHIYRTSGVRGLFQGFSATALRDAPYAGLYLAVYEKSKTCLGNLISKREESKRLEMISKNLGFKLEEVIDDKRGGTLVVSISGLIAGTTSTLLTHPFDILKTRMQIQDNSSSTTTTTVTGIDTSSRSMATKRPTLISTFNQIMKTDGSKAFLDGLGLRCARKALSGAIGWSIFEGGRGWWVKNQNERERIKIRDDLELESSRKAGEQVERIV